MHNPNTLGKYLRARRQEQGLTLLELGEKCNVSLSSISFVETGKFKSPSIWVLQRFAAYYNVPVIDLIEMVDFPSHKLKKELKLAGKIL